MQNTQKITKAMQVVAATRLRRAQSAVQATRPYAEKMIEVLQTTADLATEYRHPYLERREGNRAVLIVITADRGLCGALNSNTLRAVNRHVNEHHPGQSRYVTIGRKGRDFLIRYGRDVIADVSGLPDRPGVAPVLPAIRAALDEYDEGRADTVVLAYARWVSTLRQEPVVRTLLPLEIPERRDGAGADYLYEPGPEEVLDALLPRYIESQVYEAVLENQASFYSAQMIAMQNATNAAGDLIDSLTLTANKVRQASITTELLDIVGGAEALRG
ncbi:MAG: ATP synthase F1 subunit gamma [Chloroflexi bacterium]|jgi:F-type H+-transporting ATPase subunit gamma|nr:MAG: ATP synthase F1 subunit gamma [Chloroflexota bacterium]